jgi:hypothetical protein
MFQFAGRTRASWFDNAFLWAQLTLTDDDPGTFDPDFWLDYFKKIKAQGILLSMGGYIAFYPSKLPFQYVSPNVRDGFDAAGYLIEGCRKMDMAVVARIDPHAIHEQQKKEHPKWFFVTEDGEQRPHWSMPGAWVTCALGEYNHDYVTEIIREIATDYGVDAVFANRWAGSGICFCDTCRENFLKSTGMELPRTRLLSDRAYRAYLDFSHDILLKLSSHWNEAIRKINPLACFIPNSGLDIRKIGEISPVLFADKAGRPKNMPLWINGRSAKELRAVAGMKPIEAIFSVGLAPYRWKDSTQEDNELRLWVSEGVAQGMRPCFAKFHGKNYDDRWMDSVKDLYLRYAKWEPYLHNTENLARVALVYSRETVMYYGGGDAWRNVDDHILGAYQALLEGRVPFEMAHAGFLSDPRFLSKFKTLILPNTACLSDSQCAGIREFVYSGGGVLATLETSLYDEKGKRRGNFGLSDLFGVDCAGTVEGPLKNSYLRLDGRHPVASGFEGAQRIVNGQFRLPVRENTAFPEKPVTYIPPYPDLPMEEVYPREEPTGYAELYIRKFGKGRIAYFPWDIERIFWELLHSDHRLLFINAVNWVTGEQPYVVLEGKGFFDISVWKQERSVTVHLVNMSNAMIMRGAVRELLPSAPQKLKLELPGGCRVQSVYLLSEGEKERPFTMDKGKLEIEFPPFLDHEIAVIRLQ